MGRKAFLLLFCLLLFFLSPSFGEEGKSWKDHLSEGDELAASDRPAAFLCYERAFRTCPVDSDRRRIIRKLISLGSCSTPPSKPEQAAAEKYILGLKIAWLKNRLNGLSPQGRIAVLKEIARLSPSQKAWVDSHIREISHSLMESLTPDEKAKLDEFLAGVTPSKLDDLARRFAKQGDYRMAIKLYWAYILRKKRIKDEERDKIIAKILELTKKLTEEITPEERKKLDGIFSSPFMTDWDVRPTMKFYLVGRKELLSSLKSKDLRLLDAAYVLISDLYSNDPALRVKLPLVFDPFSGSTVYPSGIGFRAGKAAFPTDKELPLHYYYLALDWKLSLPALRIPPLALGRREVSAVYCRYMLGTSRLALKEASRLVETFERFYLKRAIPFHEMPSYDVAAGFLLAVPLKYGKLKNGEFSWLKLREVWDILRAQSWAQYPRYRFPLLYTYACAKVYGRQVYRDFSEWRLGVSSGSFSDFAMEAFTLYPEYSKAETEYRLRRYVSAAEKFWRIVRDYPACPLTDLSYRYLIYCYNAMRKREAVERIRKRMGIITRWMTIGPFYAPGYSYGSFNLAYVHPPEIGVNYAQSFPNNRQEAKWKAVAANLEGRFNLKFSYPTGAAAYALTYVRVPDEVDAWLYFSSNVIYRVWVNGRLAASQLHAGRAWRFDDDRYPIHLDKGVNRILVKFLDAGRGIFGGGRIVTRDGLPIAGMEQSIACLEKEIPAVTRPEEGDVLFDEGNAGDRRWYSRWRVTAGSFVSRKGVIYPQSTQPAGKWFRFYKYTQAYFRGPADSAWLNPSLLRRKRLGSVSFTLSSSSAAHPLFLVTFDGEGEDDPLSGVSLGFARYYFWRPTFFGVFRYDMPLYLFPPSLFGSARLWKWEIARADDRFFVRINGKELPLPLSVPAVNGRYPFGMSAWGRGIGISKLLFRNAR